MTELKNVEQELGRFRGRLLAAATFVLVMFGLLGLRLAHLQIVRHDALSTQAENNRIAVVPIVPNRGLIVDRNGIVLANNYSAYTIEVTPSKVPDLEFTIEQLQKVIEITPRDRRRFKRLIDESKTFESLPLRSHLTEEEVARFTAQRYRFPGVDIKARLFRNYPLGQVGSHLIGYIGRINQAEKDQIEDSEDEANYRGTEYIGKLGVEQSYEAELHGQTGVEEVETSASGRAVRRLKSSPPTPGNTLVMSIDIKLQALVEEMFGDRRGALVAIDPRSGEVLAFVSKPTFDPNLFVDGIDQESWRELNESIDKPLLNRALRGTYPPGSTFKPFMAIAALNTGKRAPSTIIYDNGSYTFGGHRFRSAEEGGLGPVDMVRAIEQSSNVYFYSLANELGVDTIHDQLDPFGLGRKTGIDLEGEVTGVLPSTAWKRRTYKRPELQKWYPGETISLGIGQGYNNFTMLQMSNGLSTLVSGGLRYKPRLVRDVEDVVTRSRKRIASDALPPLPLKPEHVDLIRRAMNGVTLRGTSMRVFANAGYASGGKTGTAQAVGVRANEKYNASRMEEHKRDHSLYEAFAPLDNPQIVLTVIVENAGFGAQAAAPIARRVFDYVLLGKYPSVDDMAAVRVGQAGPPIGTPRVAADVPLPGAAVVMSGIDPTSNAPPLTIPLASIHAASAPSSSSTRAVAATATAVTAPGSAPQGAAAKVGKAAMQGASAPASIARPSPEPPLPIAPVEHRDLPPEETVE